MNDWQKLGFVQDCGAEHPPLLPTQFATGWETVIFELEETGTPLEVALGELRAAIEQAEQLVDSWEL